MMVCQVKCFVSGNMMVNDSEDQTPSSPPHRDLPASSQPTFHKSDIFLERPPPPSLGSFLEFQATSPFRQVGTGDGGDGGDGGEGGEQPRVPVQCVHSE